MKKLFSNINRRANELGEGFVETIIIISLFIMAALGVTTVLSSTMQNQAASIADEIKKNATHEPVEPNPVDTDSLFKP